MPLLVDNAHGAYLNFLVGGSRPPIALGAAMCCDSGHKTLPVLTGGAYLHLGPKAPVQEETAVRNALALFGSTSPSYLIRHNPSTGATGIFRRGIRCGSTPLLRAADQDAPGAERAGRCGGLSAPAGGGRPAREPLKLTLDAAALGMTGTALAEALRQDRIECEYADPGMWC